MYNFYGVKIDTTKMTLEELEDLRSKARNMLDLVNHEIVLRKISNRKYSSKESLT